MVVNLELSLRFECHGVTSAIRSLPGLAGSVLRVRPTDALRLLYGPSQRQGGIEGGEWQTLASRMDTELDHIGSAKLLVSHTPHESCVRKPPTEARPILSLSLVPLHSAVLTNVPLARPLERVANAALTTALRSVDRILPAFPSERLGLRGKKSKTD